MVNGDMPDSAVADMIRECRLGVVWEQANDALDYPRLKNAFLEMYNKIINNGKMDFEPNREAINRYSYDRIAADFIDLFFKLKPSAKDAR